MIFSPSFMLCFFIYCISKFLVQRSISAKAYQRLLTIRYVLISICSLINIVSGFKPETISKKYIDERLPEEYEKCLVGPYSIVKEAWSTSQQTQDRRERIRALSLPRNVTQLNWTFLITPRW